MFKPLTIQEIFNEKSKLDAKLRIFFSKLGQSKMTREEAIKKITSVELDRNLGGSGNQSAAFLLDRLEALGLLKFEEKKIQQLFEMDGKGRRFNTSMDQIQLKVMDAKYGTVRLEEWPEGLVLWVGGEIGWKSWEITYKKGDRVSLRDNFGGTISGIMK